MGHIRKYRDPWYHTGYYLLGPSSVRLLSAGCWLLAAIYLVLDTSG